MYLDLISEKTNAGRIRLGLVVRRTPDCAAFVKFDLDGDRIGNDPPNHNHDAPTEKDLAREQLKNSAERKAVYDLCERSRKLIHIQMREGVNNVESNVVGTSLLDSEDS